MGLQLHEDKKPKQTTYLILLDATDQNHLQKLSRYLDDHDIEHHMFFEPDLDSYTAICTEPLPLEKRKYFKKFDLWKSAPMPILANNI